VTNKIRSSIIILMVAAAAVIVPLFMADRSVYVQLILAAIIVTGLSLFMGYAGQASLGQGAFVAIGALTVAVLTVRFHVPSLIALIAAPLIAAACAYLLGLPLLRLRGHYLAFGTLAVLLLVQALISAVPLFGGAVGIGGIPQLGIGTFEFSGQLFYVYFSLAVLAAVILVSRNVVVSRFGRGVRALAASESAAASSGVPILRTKLAVFALAGGFAGLAGGISAFFTPYVSSESFPASASFTYVIMAVVGGLGTIWGGVVGAVLITALVQLLNSASNIPSLPPIAGTVLQYIAYAIVLMAFLLFLPGGLWPKIVGLFTRRPATAASLTESISR
jgi:branched-chain amino acid transport system permease protein